MRKIVVSGINLRSGGTLSIFQDILAVLNEHYGDEFTIIALVHSRDLFEGCEKIDFMEFGDSVGSYGKRLYYEYFRFMKLSRELKPYLWLSLHDMTPRVDADIQAVYCHNPSQFYTCSVNSVIQDPKFFLFTKFYRYLYRINIFRNDFVIVQQDWLRSAFAEEYGIPPRQIVVARPDVQVPAASPDAVRGIKQENGYGFFYPSFPRVFKNFETLCAAAEVLQNKGVDDFKVYLTIDGSENKYSRSVVRRYRHVTSLVFIGLQPREVVYDYYARSDCLVFPSRLETWGLPISEMKAFGKSIIASDLPYAHETMGDYAKSLFFDPGSPESLAEKMVAAMEGKAEAHHFPDPEQPFARDWVELLNIMLVNGK